MQMYHGYLFYLAVKAYQDNKQIPSEVFSILFGVDFLRYSGNSVSRL